MTVRADGLRVYVACEGLLRGVLVVDPVAKQIVGTRVIEGAPGGIAITPSGDRLVVPARDDRAEILDAVSLTTIGTIGLAGDFADRIPVVISPDASTAYFSRTSLDASRKPNAAVIVASLADLTTTTIGLSATSAGAIALTPDGSRLVVGGDAMAIVDTATRAVVATYHPVGTAGLSAMAADATRAYASRGSGLQAPGVLAIDLASATLVAELPPPAVPLALELSPAGDRLYAADGSAFSVINPATGGVIASGVARIGIDLAAAATSPAIAPDACTYAPQLQGRGASRRHRRANPRPAPRTGASTSSRCLTAARGRRRATCRGSRSNTRTVPDRTTSGSCSRLTQRGRRAIGTITIGGQTLTITQAGCTNPIVFFERPVADSTVAQPFRISGWAINTCAPAGTGMGEWGGTRTGYGRPRPDVAAAFGAQFVNSGFEFVETFERRSGLQDLTVLLRDDVTGAPVHGTVRANVLPPIAPFGVIDTPAEGATVSGDMALTGWVMDDLGQFGSLLGVPRFALW